jgi:imidazoleglycerol-phosphate dehydratase
VNEAIGDKKGIRRYGHAYVPLDEALSRVVIDFSGRPGLVYNVVFARQMVGDFDVDLFHEFFQGFVNHAKVTLHIDNFKGENAHHQIETIFKAFGRALRMAAEPDPRMSDVTPSTKGSL